MRHRITFLKLVDDALWLVVRCARYKRARAVRFRNETQFGVVSGLRCGDFCVNTEPTPRR
jgi:hypothetical protein